VDALWCIDGSVVRAHKHAAGARRLLRARRDGTAPAGTSTAAPRTGPPARHSPATSLCGISESGFDRSHAQSPDTVR
jgi:hypothetical protein